jgi:outer membrane protein
MKNLSIALNAILLVLVIILFVMVNNLKKGMNGDSSNMGNGESVGKNKLLRIAYVNADSINSNYMLMKDFNAEIQAKEGQFQEEYNMKAKKLQDEYQAYMQKKQSGNISELDDEKAQRSLQEKKSELDGMQQQRDDLLKDVQERNFELQKKIQRFIVDYNKKAKFDYVLGYENIGGSLLYGNDSLDITKPIVSGLNAQYKDSLQKVNSAPKH